MFFYNYGYEMNLKWQKDLVRRELIVRLKSSDFSDENLVKEQGEVCLENNKQ